MKDKVVIVTGGSSGMGKAMVQKFANEGASVVMTGRNEERLKEAKAEIEKTFTIPFIANILFPPPLRYTKPNYSILLYHTTFKK